jgi:hypothetical protein
VFSLPGWLNITSFFPLRFLPITISLLVNHKFFIWLSLFLALASFPALASDPVTGRVLKVLPLFLDTNGVDAMSPSLFDRDAYQAQLRRHPEQVSAMRFDVLWKAQAASEPLTLRAELRGVGDRALPTLITLQTNLIAKTTRHWTSLAIGGADYKKFGSLVAWHVTLWDGDKMLGEQKSFLW